MVKIQYKNISLENFLKLSDKVKNNGAFCVEYELGGKDYYFYGMLHREDGPAVEYSNGALDWYLNGLFYLFEEWLEKTSLKDEEKILLKLKYS